MEVWGHCDLIGECTAQNLRHFATRLLVDIVLDVRKTVQLKVI